MRTRIDRAFRIVDAIIGAFESVCAFVGLVVITTCLVLCGRAHAQDCTSSQVLAPRDLAPCGGILIPVEHGRQCLACVKVDLPRAKADGELRVQLCDADRVQQESCCVRERTRRLQCDRDLERALEVPAPRWWTSPWVTVPAALVLGGLAGYGLRTVTR